MIERTVPGTSFEVLRAQGVPPLLARLFAARGIEDASALDPALSRLLPPDALKGLDNATDLLVEAVDRRRPICVVADYDCDGATACAVAVRGLRMLGAQVDYLVPNRMEHGYGLTPAIVELALKHPRLSRPDLLITVDNGIASVEGVERAREAGLDVLVTDHHLPGDQLPRANAIVNPNQAGCPFPSKHLAGVGVMLYVLLAVRAAFRARAPSSPEADAPLHTLLDLVALGTVADVVRLDENNRRLVAAGLRRIRAGRACAGIDALLRIGARDPSRATSADLGFAVGPRINAAGRLADIGMGVACLLSDDPKQVASLAASLDAINRDRRAIEHTMNDQALEAVGQPAPERRSIIAFAPGWHEGVVGLVASRLKSRFNRPAFAFAPAAVDANWAKGSGRSIQGVHLRDMLDVLSKRRPGLITRFGGHAMAAGLTLATPRIAEFESAFEAVLNELADPACFASTLLTDGGLDLSTVDDALMDQLESQVWGQGFPEPLFQGEFQVLTQRVVGQAHLKLELGQGRARYDAIAFSRTAPISPHARLAYRLTRNEFRGVRSIQLIVQAIDGEVLTL